VPPGLSRKGAPGILMFQATTAHSWRLSIPELTVSRIWKRKQTGGISSATGVIIL